MPNENSQPIITRRYYPTLSSIITHDDIPEILGFLKEGIQAIFDKIHYKDLQYSKSPKGDAAFYSLSIVSPTRLDIELPGTGIYLVLNPDLTGDNKISAFPITIEYQWKILAYLRAFNLGEFSFGPQQIFEIALRVLNITEEQALAHFINSFVVPTDDNITPLEQFVDDVNDTMDWNIPQPTEETSISDIVQEIYTLSNGQYASVIAFGTYLLDDDIEETSYRVKRYFRAFIPDDIDAYIRDVIVPNFKATLTLIAAIEFPRNMLIPVDSETYEPLPEPEKAMFTFAEALFYADSTQGFGYNMDLVINTVTPVQIGNSGIIINIHNLKIDLSTKTNFPEADEDGRPVEFMGVYTEQTDVILPKKWFSKDESVTQTLKISGKHLLIGTGGISGTIALEALDTGNDPGENDFYWANLGSGPNAWEIGFNSFDISFSQGDVVSSNIRAQLKIPKFTDAEGNPAHLELIGHLDENDNFDLTASAIPPFTPIIKFPEVFTYNIKTVHLGTVDNKFYLGTSGTLQFEGFLKDTLNLGPIEIERLRIYSDGTIEFEGGSVQLIEPVVLPLGPVEITVSAIHYGSHQKEVNGVMRKFNYFGFDGGVSIDPLGIEVRGDGVKYYYCVDDVEEHEKPKPYLHIKTLHLDLTIPANSGSLAQISGWVTIPEPGVSKEYAGGITLQIPKAKLAGKADIRLTPKYPAFIVDCELEMPVPIPLGSFAIYGFRGLLGYRYVAEREAVGLTTEDSWYQYYKAPKLGINVHKFSNPDQTANYQNNVTLGAGATLGTSADNGYTFSLKAMALFSIPPFFMIDGRAAILSARLGLDDTKEPPFSAFIMVGDDSLEFGLGANYKLRDKGEILHIAGTVEMGFYFKNQKPWFIHVGTKQNPIEARVISLVSIKSFLMMSAKGIEAGSRGDFSFNRDYGVIKVQASAFIEIGGKISFERPQFGAYLMAGASANIKVLFVRLTLELKILFGVEAPRPFLIYGEFYFKIKVGAKIFGKRITLFKFSGNLEVVWNFNKTVDRSAINPMINASSTAAVAELVKGVNMLSNELFTLSYLNSRPEDETDINKRKPENFQEGIILKNIIPLDTYIDIKTEKGLFPGDAQDANNSVRKLIGGINNPAEQYLDLIPPINVIRNRNIRQVIHQYSIEHLEIKFWNEVKELWEDYHPYEALYPADPEVSSLKVGHFQKTDGKYNAVRILGTTPLSYTEHGEQGWHVPEQYGINASTLFCEAEHREPKCIDFLLKPLNAKYYCANPNTVLVSDGISFKLLTPSEEDFAFVTDIPNIFEFSRSLAFDIRNSMEILFPEPTIMARLKLSNIGGNGVKLKFYSIIQTPENDVLFNVVYGNPNPNAANIDEPYEMIISADDMEQEIKYNLTYSGDGWEAINPNWRPISKIIVEPIYDSNIFQQIALLKEQIAEIKNNNELIELGLLEGDILSTELLEEELYELSCIILPSSSTFTSLPSFVNRYHKTDKLNYYFSTEFEENESFFIYSIGATQSRGLISKILPNGDLVWERTYTIASGNLIFKQIIQTGTANIVYATAGNRHYLLRFNPQNGAVIWTRELEWTGNIDLQMASSPDGSFYLKVVTGGLSRIIKVNPSGNFVSGITITGGTNQFIATAICEVDGGGIAVAGNYSDSGKFGGMILQLNQNLEITNKLKIRRIDDKIINIHDIKSLGGSGYVISGYDDNGGNDEPSGVFTVLINGEGLLSPTYFNGSTNKSSCIQAADGNFYVLINGNDNGTLHLMGTGSEPIWDKEIKLDSGSNGIKNFSFNKDSKRLTLNCYNETEGSLVVYTNENLASCLTNSAESSTKSGRFLTENPQINRTAFTTAFTTISVNSLSTMSEITRYCLGSGGCGDRDSEICGAYDEILTTYENCLIDPTTTFDIDFKSISNCYTTILDILDTLDPVNIEAVSQQIEIINTFLLDQDMETYTMAWEAVGSILDYLNETGSCFCKCTDTRVTMIHQICWMSVENYIYNINIPSQEAIEADAQATIDGITKYIQPIWRPDTSYYIHFVLKDTIDNGANSKSFSYTYGFTTAGPVGYFHINDNSTYGNVKLRDGDILFNDNHTYFVVDNNGKELRNGEDNSLYINNANGFILDDTRGILKDAVTGNIINKPGTSKHLIVNAHPDKYPLTSLAQYIDYNRSYPNADGNLLSAKPLFYNDEIAGTTQIYLFFNKAYATHFFQKWESYKNSDPIEGRLKVVIKDPVEDISIENPPYLDYDENDTIYTNIPQAVEIWEGEENPQIPFAINQYLSMYNAPNCIGEVTVIKPASEYVTIFPKHLKPNKLYTVIVNNMYDVNHDEVLDLNPASNETKEVHKFVFKTSRYKDFEEQVNSFYLEQEINGELSEREAIFNFEKQFAQDEINATYITIQNWLNDENNQQPLTGFTQEVIDTLINDYQHPYDRIFEGILGLNPWNEPVSTEVNILKDINTGNIIALIVRNPEPFNNPKFRKEVIADTIEVIVGGQVNNSYSVLFSKDNSQAIIMNTAKNITENLSLKFRYKIYEDLLPGDDVVINYPVKTEVELDIDLLNN